MEKPLQQLQLTGYASHSYDGIGFCLPIFGHALAWELQAIQYVDEITQTISLFKKTKIENNQFISVPEGKLYSTGDQAVFVFVDAQRTPHCGFLGEISDALRKFEADNPRMTEVILQIKELIGSQTEKRELRKKFRNKLFDAGDKTSAHSFMEDSVLRSELWTILLKSAPNNEAAHRILSCRSKMSVKIGNLGKVEIDLFNLSPSDYSQIKFEDIVKHIQNELDETSKPDYNDNTEKSIDDLLIDQRAIDSAISETRRAGRQEERVTILIRIFLEDFDLGRSVLSIYQSDRGQFATQAIKIINSTLATGRLSKKQATENVVTLIKYLYRICYPMNRGALLFFFAHHIGQYPEVASIIKNRLYSSDSKAINYWRENINRALLASGAKAQQNDPETKDLFL